MDFIANINILTIVMPKQQRYCLLLLIQRNLGKTLKFPCYTIKVCIMLWICMQDCCLYCGASEASFVHPECNASADG